MKYENSSLEMPDTSQNVATSSQSVTRANDEETRYYLAKAQNGDILAKEYLVEKNMGLVYSLIQRFTGRGFERDDLCQVGIIGLLKAINNFDLSYNNCFSTYAVPMIIGEVKRAIRDDQPIHISRNYKELAYKIYKLKEEYIQEHGKEPSISLLAESLQVNTNDILIAMESNRKPASLQMSLEEKGGKQEGTSNQLQDIIANDESEDKWLDQIHLKQVFAKLPPRLKYIIQARYFTEKTQEEIAKNLGVSQVQISRLEKQALKILKEYWQE